MMVASGGNGSKRFQSFKAALCGKLLEALEFKFIPRRDQDGLGLGEP